MASSPRAEALLACIATKFLAEGLVDSVWENERARILRYRTPRHWPGPPAFDFTLEVLAADGNLPAPAHEIIRGCPDEALVVRTFAREAPEDREAMFMPLLACDVPSAPAPAYPFPIRQLTTLADVEHVNLTHRDTNAVRAGILGNAQVHALWLEKKGQAVASGTLVLAPPAPGSAHGLGYIADMYTLPDCREQGLGSAMLDALLDRARELDLREVILLPSPQARQIGFYERFGFRFVGGLTRRESLLAARSFEHLGRRASLDVRQ